MKKLLRQFSSDEFEAFIQSMKGSSSSDIDASKPIDITEFVNAVTKPPLIDSLAKTFDDILDTMVGTNKILARELTNRQTKFKEQSMEAAADITETATKSTSKRKLAYIGLHLFGIKQELKRIMTSATLGVPGAKKEGLFGKIKQAFGGADTSMGLGSLGKVAVVTAGAAVVGYGISSMFGGSSEPPSSSTSAHMQTLYSAFIKHGMTPEGAKTMIAQINRENNFQEQHLFGMHIDPANGAVNAGIISWQGDRGKKFLDFMASRGFVKDNKIVRSKEALEAQAEFLVREMSSDKKYRPSWEAVTKPNLTYRDIESVVGDNYVRWRRTDPRYSASGYANQNRGYDQISRLVENGFGQPMKMETFNSIVSSIAPGMTRVSDEFGTRGGKHMGLDIAGKPGSPIRSVGAGKVIRADGRDSGGYGLRVEIDHGNGKVTTYSHLNSIDVKVGQRIDQGTVIGTLGNTGRSTGPHLHFEVKEGGKFVDPKIALQSFQEKPKPKKVVQPLIIPGMKPPKVSLAPPPKPKGKGTPAQASRSTFPEFYRLADQARRR